MSIEEIATTFGEALRIARRNGSVFEI